MLVVTVTFTVTADGFEEFLTRMTENASRSLSDEPGCRRFDVCTAADDRPVVFLYELYDDEAAFDAHKASAHYSAFSAAVEPLVADKAVDIWRLTTDRERR